MNEYPEELRNPVIPVVALVGLPANHQIIEKNVVTKTLYDVNTPIFKFVSLEGHIPLKKEKRPNYESYVPNGILKANWMHKHKNILPSVIVLLCNWETSNWKENETEICTQISIVQQSAKTRNIKILVVLFHALSSEPSANDEKFISLRKRSDLDAKNFLFVPKNDLKSHLKRFEKIVQDLSNAHYTEAARRIKNMRAHVNKTSQISLYIRLQFKLGYYAEFRPDKLRSALKHYTAGYNLLREMKMMDHYKMDHIRMTEIKIVASYINFKTCMLFFTLGNATEAVQQFQRHTRLYRSSAGLPFPDREYEHWAWVSREYQVFGELLCMFSAHALHTKGHYHPGFYFGAAAKYAMDRKKAAKRYVEPVKSQYEKASPPKPMGIDLNNMVYVGQPPLSLSHPLEQFSDGFTPDAQEEQVRSISQELAVEHSTIIIDLLTKTWHHYKRVVDEQKNVIHPKASRTILYIASQMAQEHYQAGQWAKAKNFYDKISKNYRREEWYTLLTHSLECSLLCAQKLGNTQEYLAHALDLITTRTTNTQQDKLRIQSDILKILENPEPPLALSAPVELNLANYKVNVKVQFTKDTAFAYQKFLFLVRVSSKFPGPIKFSQILIEFNDSSYNTHIDHDSQLNSYYDNSTGKPKPGFDGIVLEKQKPKIYEVPLMGKQKADLACTSVTLILGKNSSSIHLKKTIEPTEPTTAGSNLMKEKGEKGEGEKGEYTPSAPTAPTATAQVEGASAAHLRRDVSFSHIMRMDARQLGHQRKKFLEKSCIEVLDSEPKVDIKLIHSPPALINEYYKVDLVLTNNDDDINWGTLTWNVVGQQNDSSIFSTRATKATPVDQVPVGKIRAGASFKQSVFVFSSSPDEKQLSVNLAYETANHKTNMTQTVTFPVQVGFTVKYQVFTETLQLLHTTTDTLHAQEPLLLLAEINPLPSYPLNLCKTDLVINTLDGSNSVAKVLSSSGANNAIVTRHNRYAAWFKILPTVCGEFSLGQLIVYWKRHDPADADAPFTITKTPLPLVKITRPYFSVSVDSAAAGVVGQAIPHTITITNHTTLPQEFSLLVVPQPASLSSSSSPSSSPAPHISAAFANIPPANLTSSVNVGQKGGSQLLKPPVPVAPTPGISEVFLISGDRQSSFSIHPHSTHVIKHTLLPIVAGNHLRPHFQITSKRLLKELSQTKYDERFIFVRPQLNPSNN